MTLVCRECGSQIPADMDFCPRCGSYSTNALKFDERGYFVQDTCTSCGAELEKDSRFCIKCGAPVSNAPVYPVRVQMRKNGSLALAIGLIFGFLNIYGVGHLVMRRWSRGFMFLGITAVLMYMDPTLLFSSNMMFTMIRIGIYMYQCMDLLGIVYGPEAR